MNASIAIGANAMAEQQAALERIAANLANIDTPGYRAQRTDFAALLGPDGHAIGAQESAPRLLLTQGKIEETNNQFDFAVDGEGLFRVTDASGNAAYTRAGNFTPDAKGLLRLPNGAALSGIKLPRGTTSIEVGDDGTVRARVAGKSTSVTAGRIHLYQFADGSALRCDRDALLYAKNAPSIPFSGAAGSGGFGHVRQRSLERANITVMEAMMAVLSAQRAYEASAKTVQAADEMLRLANNLQHG